MDIFFTFSPYVREVNPTVDKVAKLRILYFKIVKLKEYINDTYSFRIFLTMAFIFIEFVYLAFFIIVFVRIPETGGRKLSTVKSIKIFLWSSSINGKMLFLIMSSNKVMQKIKRTGSVINNFLTKPVDSHTKEEVKFSY